MIHRSTRLLLSMFFILVASASAFGQVNTSQFQGRVTDPQQRVVAGAEVRIVENATGVEHTLKTNGEGLYTAPFLSPGTYVISVQAAGFATASSEPLTVTVGQTLAFDVQLKVGGTNEQVTVNAGASEMVNTTDASVSTVIDRQFVANIPLNGRSFQDLISLTPGVITTTPQDGGLLGVSGDFSINGQRTESNGYIVDGVSANFSAGNGSGIGDAGGNVPAVTALGTSQALTSIDDLQEFRVLSSSYSAEFGRATGGQITFVTRSGTNDVHGTLFEYLRNDVFDANNWFNDWLHQRKPPLRQSDFGGSFGAPVRIPKLYNGKDKTFFFVSYEGLRLIQPQSASIVSVPDANLRTNAVGAMKQIVNALPLPNLGVEEMVPCGDTTQYSKTNPYPCPAGTPAGTHVPVPSGLAEFAEPYSLPDTLNAISVRLDENITSRMSAFFRFANTPSGNESRPNDLSVVSVFHSNTRTYTAGITNQLSNNITNSFRLGYGSNSMATNGYVDSFGGATPIDYSAVAGATGPFPEPVLFFQIPGTIGEPFTLAGSGNHSAQWNAVDAVSIIRGRHQLKFGFDYRRVTSSVQGYDPLADAIVQNVWQIQNNLPSTFQTIVYQPGKPLFHQYALFAQDEWRVTSRLSLSMGLRWEVDPPPSSANGEPSFTLTGSIGDPSSLALAPRGTPLWKTPYFNFAPRLGGAYQLRTDPGWDTVLRAGGGVFFDNDNWLGSGTFQALGFSGSYACPSQTCGFPETQAEIAMDAPNTTAPYTHVTIYDYPNHMQLPYSLQWNVSVQQALGAAQSLTLSYVGASARRLPNLEYYSLNSFNSNFGTVISAFGNIHSNYNALQASFQRRLSHGLQVLASYDWAHTLDNKSEGIGIEIGRREIPPTYGNSDLDLRHNFVAGITWDLPAVNHDSITRTVLSHWGLDARFTDRTSFPVQILGLQGVDPNSGQSFYSGVIQNPGVPVYLYGAACTAYYSNPINGNPIAGRSCPGGRAINPAAFSATMDLSNPAPKDAVRGFGENQINLAIRREFPIWENLKLQFRAETYNILNHPNFGSMNPQIGSSSFGLVSATLNNNLGGLAGLYQQGGSRSMQFALKLIF